MTAPPPILVVVQENRAPLRRELRGELVLGRDPDVDLPLEDNYLSRRHCRLSLRGDQIVARDLGSYNGSYLNGHKLEGDVALQPGDVLQVGHTRVFVDWGQNPEDSLRVLAPSLEPRPGVRPVSHEAPPQLRDDYRDLAKALPSHSELSLLESSMGIGPSTRRSNRPPPEERTPIPPPAVEDSAVARRGGTSRPSGQGHGYRTLAQIARLLAAVPDVQTFLDRALSRILEVIPAERGILMRLDPERRSLYAECVKSAVPNVDDQTARRLGISHTIAKKVVRERISIVVDDAVLDKRFREASSIQELQIRSILCVPLWLGEDVSGLIYLDHLLHAYAFSQEDRDLLVAAGNMIALALTRLHPGQP